VIALTLAELAQALGGSLVLPEGVRDDALVSGSVETDSRLVSEGSVFFALPGEETDGHLFAPAAVEAGAALVVAERTVDVDVPQLIVPEGVAALAAMARLVVDRVRSAGHLRVVAITGSNGKTTTKNLLRAVLEAEGPTVAPPGSFNNQVGAPVSMLRVDESTEYLVVEMGASHEGEIARLVSIVTPDIAVVLKVGLAHAGEFGGVEAI
jgi:UDP-N-acetylmuramoyl-tripeptide--D-alanyl-D-alanine ligase